MIKRQCDLENFSTGDLPSERDVRHDEHWKVLIFKNTKVYYDSNQNDEEWLGNIYKRDNQFSITLFMFMAAVVGGVIQCSNQTDKSLANGRLHSLSYRFIL